MTATTANVAAWVDGTAVTVEEVDARMTSVRAALFGTRLPSRHTAEGRNVRRWVVQLLCAERLVRAELADRGIAVQRRPARIGIDRALAVGGVAAAVLAAVPEAAALVNAHASSVDDSAVRGYYERNGDQFADRGIAFADAREGIADELRSATADRAFGAWLEQRMSAAVVLAAGYEHPADPAHPDATHRH